MVEHQHGVAARYEAEEGEAEPEVPVSGQDQDSRNRHKAFCSKECEGSLEKHERHQGIEFSGAVLEVHQRARDVDGAHDEDAQDEESDRAGDTVDVLVACFTRAAKATASPPSREGGPEGCWSPPAVEAVAPIVRITHADRAYKSWATANRIPKRSMHSSLGK